MTKRKDPRASVLSRLPRAALLLGLTIASTSNADAPPTETTAKTSTIDVTVTTFRNRNGALGCRLFASPAGFASNADGFFAQRRVAIDGPQARCVFTKVPAGTYAVTVLHDENTNGKLDTNLFGAPTEGYGASNNHTHAMSAPSWDESKFVVAASTSVRLSVALRY